ncbi:MAG: hypothetical protein PHH14_00280 [Candidatus Margulisbacteria bacterium]|nr:hypothetical protein [Candidatus Margulisiibacteriota bacterium]
MNTRQGTIEHLQALNLKRVSSKCSPTIQVRLAITSSDHGPLVKVRLHPFLGRSVEGYMPQALVCKDQETLDMEILATHAVTPIAEITYNFPNGDKVTTEIETPHIYNNAGKLDLSLINRLADSVAYCEQELTTESAGKGLKELAKTTEAQIFLDYSKHNVVMRTNANTEFVLAGTNIFEARDLFNLITALNLDITFKAGITGSRRNLRRVIFRLGLPQSIGATMFELADINYRLIPMTDIHIGLPWISREILSSLAGSFDPNQPGISGTRSAIIYYCKNSQLEQSSVREPANLGANLIINSSNAFFTQESVDAFHKSGLNRALLKGKFDGVIHDIVIIPMIEIESGSRSIKPEAMMLEPGVLGMLVDKDNVKESINQLADETIEKLAAANI